MKKRIGKGIVIEIQDNETASSSVALQIFLSLFFVTRVLQRRRINNGSNNIFDLNVLHIKADLFNERAASADHDFSSRKFFPGMNIALY